MTDKDTEDAAEVAAAALEVYYEAIIDGDRCGGAGFDAVLIAASNLVAADTIATALLEARP